MSITAEELEAAYQRGRKASPEEINPFQHYHPALHQEWDNGQRDAFLERLREPAPAMLRITCKLLAGVLSIAAVVSVYNSLQ